ncbi:hypothetical protein Vi05172_g3166 [Venturia inaequalis]|nr:hypothetical protein EG327_007970 [Venturia inaequalis]RDI86924.1 hypothetical protein Vi05172_g3166 [Venturia inaequalis]
MPTFESLSRELRQEIFRIAFTDTVADDLEFCLNTRKYICNLHFDSKLRNLVLPDFLSSALAEKVDGSWFDYSYTTLAFAPSTGTTAIALRQVFPDIADDIQFVLERCLHRFEQRLKQNIAESGEDDDDSGEDIYYDGAVAKYGKRAQERGELYDRGGGLGGKNVSRKMMNRYYTAVNNLGISHQSTF